MFLKKRLSDKEQQAINDKFLPLVVDSMNKRGVTSAKMQDILKWVEEDTGGPRNPIVDTIRQAWEDVVYYCSLGLTSTLNGALSVFPYAVVATLSFMFGGLYWASQQPTRVAPQTTVTSNSSERKPVLLEKPIDAASAGGQSEQERSTK